MKITANPWKTTKKNLVYQNRFGYSLYDNEVVHPSGKIGHHMVLNSQDFVMVVAIDKQDKLILINQWRYPTDSQVIELPAGRVEIGESPIETAKKELLEETGATSLHWQEIGSFPFMVGFANIRGHYFLARDAIIEKKQRDVDSAKSKIIVLDYDKIDLSKTSAECTLGLLLYKKNL